MCRPSVISDDWVMKGFHVHIEHVELVVRPGHRRGEVVFKNFFSSAAKKDVEAAVKDIRDRCLEDPTVRKQWCSTIDRAIGYLEGYRGELAELANGRKAELTFLKRALLAYESR